MDHNILRFAEELVRQRHSEGMRGKPCHRTPQNLQQGPCHGQNRTGWAWIAYDALRNPPGGIGSFRPPSLPRNVAQGFYSKLTMIGFLLAPVGAFYWFAVGYGSRIESAAPTKSRVALAHPGRSLCRRFGRNCGARWSDVPITLIRRCSGRPFACGWQCDRGRGWRSAELCRWKGLSVPHEC